jgi:DNA polymerase-3 subunit alpha
MVDLHRHDEFSTFDGFGKAKELARLAKELGHTALSITNHGNTNGLIKHYQACKEMEIDCIMGVEGYFQPIKYSEEERALKPRFHLCLYAKNLKGYENINNIQYEAEKNKYYNPIITFEMLEQYNEGVICSSACINGYISKALLAGKQEQAEKAVDKFIDIFGDDFYIEIQPYKIDNEGTQEKVNVALMKLAKKKHVKCILTSDSHYGSPDDFDTYLKLHEIAKHDLKWVKETYGERYMPSEKDIKNRCYKMHKADIEKLGYNAKQYINKMLDNIEEIHGKCEQNILDVLKEELPKINDNSFNIIKQQIKLGLKRIGKEHDKTYINRCKEELKVIEINNFADYFLIVQDYVKYAESQGINVGPGRGSVCNCEIAYLLGITKVDSIAFGLDFRRFLREDKKKLPDIDLDFETSRRQEVIDYLIAKYRGKAAQVCSYGLYKVDNCINDLAKVCGLEDASEIKSLKAELKGDIDDTLHFHYDETKEIYKHFNERYENIVKHFNKLYNKVRFIGTHAAGVAITKDNLKTYCGVRVVKDKATGVMREFTTYDLADLEIVHVVKFDMLGLRTMESLGELRRLTGVESLPQSAYTDKKLYEQFAKGNCDGIFQFETNTPRQFLIDCHCDCFDDIVAISSMNRPGPLSMHMPQQYCENKLNPDKIQQEVPYYEYVQDTYGIIVYQEQLQRVAVEVGNLSWQDADRLMKLMKQAIATMGDLDSIEAERKDMTERFVKGAMSNGWSEEDARTTFKGMMKYLFNKGHSVGYSMITLEEMYHKVYNPLEYWYTKIKYEDTEIKRKKFAEKACLDGCVLMLPHVNLSNSKMRIRKVEGEKCLQQGLSEIKDVGEKAAEYIVEERKQNGVFTSYDNFYDRCKCRVVTSRVIAKLKEEGALEFNKKIYISRVTKYNSALYSRAMK